MKNYSFRIWKDGDGHWYAVTNPARVEIARAWRSGNAKFARDEARSAIARDQAERRAETARAA
jgi:hypothetical protein